jgi:hypothetical protein
MTRAQRYMILKDKCQIVYRVSVKNDVAIIYLLEKDSDRVRKRRNEIEIGKLLVGSDPRGKHRGNSLLIESPYNPSRYTFIGGDTIFEFSAFAPPIVEFVSAINEFQRILPCAIDSKGHAYLFTSRAVLMHVPPNMDPYTYASMGGKSVSFKDKKLVGPSNTSTTLLFRMPNGIF